MSSLRAAAVVAGGLGVGLALRAIRKRGAYDFAGRVVVITGGSRGLGLVMARQLADEGARLVLLARDAEELARAEEELRTFGAEVSAWVCDVRDQDQVEGAVERVIRRYGRIDVLINNAGVIQAGPIEHMTTEDFQDALAVHTLGPLYTMLAAIPQMRRQGGGRIVNISSIGGKVAVPHLVPYVTSKFALVGLSDGMRAELAKDSIVVTTVCPGLMRTGSHLNALFKGRHQAEFTWFSLLDSLPLVSIDARRAARQIIDACRHGRPLLVISTMARLMTVAQALAPDTFAQALKLFGRLLPAPAETGGERFQSGWESQSALAPSLLTRLSDWAAVRNNGLRGHAPPV